MNFPLSHLLKEVYAKGASFPPTYLNIYTEFIFRESNDLVRICIHGHNINNIRYADDTALMANNQEQLQKVVSKVKDESSRAGLDMNVKKTKAMVLSKEPAGKTVEIKVNNVVLEQVDTFKYLGTQVKDDLKTDKEIVTRENLAKSKFCSMSKVLTSKRLKMSTRLNILKCYVFSIYCYGCEAWTLNKTLERKIDVFEMWCLRRMGKFKWSDLISNEDVLKTLKTKRTLLKNVKSRKLKYYGHIKRKNNILTTALEGKMEGKRPQGRPRKTWFSDIKEWTGLKGWECTRMATDRNL